MRLLARGRDAEIFELGDDRVLRRAIDGRHLASEAAVMAHAHAAGVPVPAAPDLPRSSLPGDRLLHLDLHVRNVIRTADGPVLIDWTNAMAGPAAADLAMTWILHSSASPG